MPIFIQHDDGPLRGLYNTIQRFLGAKYRSPHSELPPDTRTEQQRFNDGCEEAHARQIAEGHSGGEGFNSGKDVV
jgi:hypothetical protein